MNSLKKISFIAISFGLLMGSCKKKDAPLTVPKLTTTVATNVTSNTATSGGTISSDGGSPIEKTGICWSKTNPMPTIADEKMEGTETTGAFVSQLTNLASNSTYYVRAYAVNSAGTGYGNVVTFATGNAGPMAINVAVTGDAKVNSTLTATYTYTDAENDLEAGSTYKWYVANDATGIGETAIAGATTKTYVVQEAEQGKFIRFGVVVRAATGTAISAEIKSVYIGAIGEPTTVTFIYNGASVTYGIINSPTTGRKWLDRNLGASNVASAVDNHQNYGDLFQWGRLADGHQLISRSGPNDVNAQGVNGGTTKTAPFQFSSIDIPGHNLFIINALEPSADDPNRDPLDWRKPQNNNLWQGVNGSNNPCPSGWRIPTADEWTAEAISSLVDGYTKLKLTYTGVRTGSTNEFFQSTSNGNYWSSSIGVVDPKWAIRIRINAEFGKVEQPRVNGYACRCIKN